MIDLQHHHERHGKYRLEDEELTHLGQSLGEIDKFEDVQLSDNSDDDDADKEDAGKRFYDLQEKKRSKPVVALCVTWCQKD